MSQMGVYKSYRLARSGNGFDIEFGKRLERDNHVIANEYAETINQNSKINGLFYEKDEEATKLYLSGKSFKDVKSKKTQPKSTNKATATDAVIEAEETQTNE